jgi:predicted nucleic acid-binding protein
MLIISDTNILSSMAAGAGFHLLSRLFPGQVIYIPPAVQKELQAGFRPEQIYLEVVLQAIDSRDIQVLDLSATEQRIAQALPTKLNDGECEAIALAQNRKGRLLSNDKKAVRYCRHKGIKVVDLPYLLRELWIRKIISQDEVKALIHTMKTVENLALSQKTLDKIFTPPPRRRRRRRRKS